MLVTRSSINAPFLLAQVSFRVGPSRSAYSSWYFVPTRSTDHCSNRTPVHRTRRGVCAKRTAEGPHPFLTSREQVIWLQVLGFVRLHCNFTKIWSFIHSFIVFYYVPSRLLEYRSRRLSNKTFYVSSCSSAKPHYNNIFRFR